MMQDHSRADSKADLQNGQTNFIEKFVQLQFTLLFSNYTAPPRYTQKS